MAVDADGNVYVIDSGNNRIQKFDASGNYRAQWGGNGTPGDAFNLPEDVAIGPDGSIYVADGGNNRILKFGYGATAAKASTWGRIKSLYR
jgi:DNA-binding beta-propeller fold protein YncE